MTQNVRASDLILFGRMASPGQEALQQMTKENQLMQMVLNGTPEQQRVLATAENQQTRLGNSQELADIHRLTPSEFAAKYGYDAALGLGGYVDAARKLQNLKERERTTGETVADTALSAVDAATGLAGGIATLGAMGFDGAARGAAATANALAGRDAFDAPPALSPHVAVAAGKVSDAIHGSQSQLMQDRRAQHALEGELKRLDREATYQEDLAKGDGEFLSSLRKYGQAAVDTVSNYGDDPIMLGDKVPEALGSILGYSAAIRGAAKLAGTSAVDAVAATTMAIESGSAAAQTQQEIMGMSEADLQDSPEYQMLRNSGMSHEKARSELALSAGAISGAITAPGALLAGKIAAPFAANPLSVGSHGLRSAVGHVASEGVEETIQEGNSQFAGNVGKRYGAGLNVALDEGVVEAATEGGIGGVMGAGPLQGAGLAGSTAKRMAKAVATRTERILDEASPTGTKAREEGLMEFEAFGETALTGIVDDLAQADSQITPEQSEAKQRIAKKLQDALFADPQEAEANPDLGLTAGDRLLRHKLVEKSAKTLADEKASADDKVMAAVQILSTFNDVAKLASEDLAQSGLDEGIISNIVKVKETAKLWESSGLREAALDQLKTTTFDDLNRMTGLTEGMLKDLPAEAKQSFADMFDMISQANPTGIPASAYAALKEQVGDSISEEVATSLQVGEDMATIAEAADAAKASIMEDQGVVLNQSLNGNPATGTSEQAQPKGKVHRTWDMVRNDITMEGNANNKLPSLAKHRSTITGLFRAGQSTEGNDALDELMGFAKSQINKMIAFNHAAATGASTPETGVHYQAYGPFQKFFQSTNGAWVNVKSASSVALMREIHIDTMAAVDLYNSLNAAYGDGVALVVPPLNDAVMDTLPKQSKGRKIHKERRLRKDAVLKIKESLIDYSNDTPLTAEEKAKKTRQAQLSRNQKRRDAYVKRRPFTQLLKNHLGKKGVDPQSPVGEELKALEITPQTAIGLFRKGGVKALDNLLASEFGEYAYLIESDGNGYLSQQGVLDALSQELAGSPLQDSEELAKAQAQDDLVAQEKAEQKAAEPVAEVTPKQTEAKPEPVAKVEAAEPVAVKPKAEPKPAKPAQETVAQKSWFETVKDRALKTAAGVNYFTKAFRPSKSNPSTLVSHKSPAKFLLSNLTALANDGNALKRELSQQEQARLSHMLSVDMPLFIKDLTELVSAQAEKLDWFKSLEEGKEVLAYPNAGILNFYTKLEDGTYVPNQAAMEALYMAAMEWVMQDATKGTPKLKDSDILDMFGLPRDAAVTSVMRLHVQSGVSMQAALTGIADRFMTLLGVKPDKTVSATLTQGLMKHMAANALHLLEKADFFTRQEEYRRDENGDITGSLTMLKFSEELQNGKMLQEMKAIPDVFTQIFTPGHTKARHIAEIPKGVPTTQMGNSLAPLSKKERSVVERLQQMPNFVNIPMVDVLMALGEERYKKLMGWKAIDPKKMNQKDFASQDGKNKSLDRAWAESFGYVDETLAVSEATGSLFSETPIFFRWAISSVGRLQQQGRITPQGDKTFRELVSSTFSTVDMSQDANKEVFWLAVAQSLGMGIEKAAKASNIAKVQKMLKEDLSEAVALLEIYLETEELDADKFSDAVAGIEMTPKALHALLTVARYNQVEGTSKEKTFRTALAIEADGKTDGPINAMIHMLGGAFNANQIRVFAKGGLFFTNEPVSLSQYMERESAGYDSEGNKKPPHKDLYTTAAEIFASRLKAFANESPEAFPTLAFLATYLDGFDMVASGKGKIDELEVSRSITKNPLTVFLYGSGENGIAGKILDAAMEGIYQKLSRLAAGEANVFSKDELAILSGFLGKETVLRLLEDPVKAELTFAEIERARELVNDHFGKQMLSAIDDTTQGLGSNMKLTQLISQVQAYIFQAKLKVEMEKRREQRIKEGVLHKNQELSENDMNQVFAEVMKIAPIYHTNAQQFHIAAQAHTIKKITRTNKDGSIKETGRTISRSVAGDYQSELREVTAEDPSVKVSPFLTIGTGDGRMILNIFDTVKQALANALAVFDGVEQGIAEAAEASEHINASVFQGWMDSNVYRSISEGYAQLLSEISNDMLVGIPAQTLAAIQRRVGKKPWEPVTVSDLVQLFHWVDALADQVDARKYAMSKLPTQTDHMAGMEKPSANGDQTIDLDPTDFEGIADRLNSLAREYMLEHQKEARKDTEHPVVQPPSKTLTAAVERMGEPVDGYPKVFRLTGSQVLKYLRKEKGLSKGQKEVLFQLLHKENLADATYYFGSREDLTAVRNRDYKSELWGKNPIQLGQYSSMAGGVAFIANISPETVMHEMLHSHTYRVLKEHYLAPDKSSEAVQVAVAQLERLMQTMLDLRISDPALQTLRRELDGHPPKSAVRMTEFLSWALSNQRLIEIGQKKKSYAVLSDTLRKVMYALKKLLGIKHGPVDTVFSQIRFNTELLISKPQEAIEAEQNAVLDEVLNQSFPDQTGSLNQIEQRFLNRLTAFWNASKPDDTASKVTKARYAEGIAQLQESSLKALDEVQAHGYDLNEREQIAFRTIHSAMTSGMALDATLLRQVNDLYGHVLKELRSADYLAALGQDGEANPNLAAAAQEKVDFLVHPTGDMLAKFTALALVHEEFGKVLQSLQAPKGVSIRFGSADEIVKSVANSLLNLLTRLNLQGIRSNNSVGYELDRLGMALSELKEERSLLASLHLSRRLDQVEDWTSGKLQKGAEKATSKLNALRQSTSLRPVKAAVGAAAFVTSFGSKDNAREIGNGMTRLLNVAPGLEATRELLTNIRGMTEANAPLLRLLNPARYQVDKARQEYREGVPKSLAEAFSRKLAREEWSAMTTVIAMNDLLVMGRRRVLDLLKNQHKLPGEIKAAEQKVKDLGGRFSKKYLEKSKALARMMATGELTSDTLQRNATAIANLLSENVYDWKQIKALATPELIQAIDELVSLYAFELTDRNQRENMASLVREEPEGMTKVVGLLHELRRLEKERAEKAGSDSNLRAVYNGWKGYVPAVTAEGQSLIVEDDSKAKELALMGYERVGAYKGDSRQGYQGKRSYYRSTVGGKAAFRQGVAQTVHDTFMGVDSRTGQSRTGVSHGLIIGKKAQRIANRTQFQESNTLVPGEYLLPLFNEDKEIVAYEPSLSPEKIRLLRKDTHLGRMLGIWAGRIAEEEVAQQVNADLLGALHEIYQKEGRNGAEFVNVADKQIKDPVIRDAWDTLGWRIKQDAELLFGEKNFLPIRKDMLEDAIGSRAASVTDPWTGISRWSPKTQAAVKDFLVKFYGPKIFQHLKMAENTLQDVVSYAKTTIVVRSIFVGVENFLSNYLVLTALHGMGPIEAAKAMRVKFVETTQFVRNQEEIHSLKVDLAASFEIPEQERIKARISALEAANARMSIKPLIDAGEFSTISEDLTEADVAIREGKLTDYFGRAADKLPGWGRDTVKNFLITKDTELFTGLNRVNQYGDFLAKAVLYDHLKKKGKSEQEVLDRLFEEFVPYNRPVGRTRGALENNGMLWFTNYKIRIMNVAFRAMQERPVSALLTFAVIAPLLGISTPWSGSLAGALLAGTALYNVGPSMGLHAGGLNPWINMFW